MNIRNENRPCSVTSSKNNDVASWIPHDAQMKSLACPNFLFLDVTSVAMTGSFLTLTTRKDVNDGRSGSNLLPFSCPRHGKKKLWYSNRLILYGDHRARQTYVA